jgi:DNA-binding NarL/FixJ family response regulator
MKYNVNIVLVDDEELFRTGIAFILNREPNMNVLFQASNGVELLERLKTADILPDIIMMDLKMPLLNGVETTKILKKDYPEIDIIALSSYNSKAFIANVINEGACSYIIKSATPAEMIETINKVALKGFYYDNVTMKVILEEKNLSQNDKTKSPLDEEFFTPREKEVLELICKQFNTKEIGEKLFISPRTVEIHRKNIISKTNSKNIAGLVVFAIQNDIVPPDNLLDE